MKHLFFIILFFSFLTAVKAQTNQSSPTAIGTKNKVEDKESEQLKMIVTSLKIIKSKKQYAVSLSNTRILNTTKKLAEAPAIWNKNDFVCFILDEHKRTLDTLVVSQPLNVRYEFPTEDGTIGSKVVDLPENEVLLRFRYSVEMKYLRLERAVDGGKLNMVGTMRLRPVK